MLTISYAFLGSQAAVVNATVIANLTVASITRAWSAPSVKA
jgi:hypothetical protein